MKICLIFKSFHYSFRASDDEYEVFRRKMVLPSVQNGRVIEARKYEFRAVEGRGRGLFLTEDVKAGDTIVLEEPAVIGPKQMSPLVGISKLIGCRNRNGEK